MRRTFAALRHRNYRIWAAADLVSITGTWMQVFGISWFVLQITGSAASMGLAVLLQALPVLLLGPFGGALADRLPGRPVLIATQIAHGVLALALAAIALSPQPGLAPVYGIALAGGLISALEGPVMGRFNATVVDRGTLSNALSLGSLINSSGRIIGMSAGGLVVAMVGPAPLFIANAASFLAVVFALLAIRPASLHSLDTHEPAPAGSTGVRAGFSYLLRQPVVLVALGLAVVLGSLGRNYQVTMAAMSEGPLGAGAGGYGMLSTAFAVGAVLGGLVAARRPKLDYRTLIGAGILTSVLQVTAGFAPGLWTFAAAIVPIAAGAVLIDTTVATRIQLDTRGDMRGRVLAAAAMASAAAGATGAPLLGWLAEAVGPREALILAGTVAGLASLVAGAMLARRRGVAVHPHQLRLALAAAVGWPVRQQQVAGATLAQPVPA